MNGVGHDRLAGAGLSGDEHGSLGWCDKVDLGMHLPNGGGVANDVVMRALVGNRFLQVSVFLFQPVAQLGDLRQGRMQLPVVELALGHVAKDHDGPGKDLVMVDRGRNILHLDRFSVLSPEDFILDPVDLFGSEGLVNRAVMSVIDASVDVVVVDDVVDRLAKQVVGVPSQHLLSGSVDEGRVSLRVDAVDAFASCIEDELVLKLEFREELLGATPAHQSFPVQLFGFGYPRMASELIQIKKHKKKGGGSVPDPAGAKLDVERITLSVPQPDAACPGFASMGHFIQEDDECGDVAVNETGEAFRLNVFRAEQFVGVGIGLKDRIA